jgi:hypothetical protein
MAEKILDRAQVAACGQKMRREAVAHGMGRCRRRQAERAPCLLHRARDEAGVQGAAARAAEKGGVRFIGDGEGQSRT